MRFFGPSLSYVSEYLNLKVSEMSEEKEKKRKEWNKKEKEKSEIEWRKRNEEKVKRKKERQKRMAKDVNPSDENSENHNNEDSVVSSDEESFSYNKIPKFSLYDTKKYLRKICLAIQQDRSVVEPANYSAAFTWMKDFR
jgi:hypothetical protein